jgi:hypothetical protein
MSGVTPGERGNAPLSLSASLDEHPIRTTAIQQLEPRTCTGTSGTHLSKCQANQAAARKPPVSERKEGAGVNTAPCLQPISTIANGPSCATCDKRVRRLPLEPSHRSGETLLEPAADAPHFFHAQ